MRRLVPTRPWLLMAAFTVAVVATSAREALRRYDGLQSGWSWDLAYYNQWFRALTLGDGAITVNPIGPLTTEGPSVWNMNYLTPVRLAIAPVYWMVPGPRTLLVLHAVVFWMTIPAAFGLVRSETGSGWVALSAAILVPLTPLLCPLAVNDFRELQLAIPFVLWATHGVRARDVWRTALGVGGLLACRQECALVVAMLAFLPPRIPEGIVRRDRWMLGLWVTGLGWVLFAFLTYAKWFVNSQAWAISFEQVGSSIPLGMRMETLGGLAVVGLGSWALLACLAPRAGVLVVPWAWKVAGGLFAIRLLGTESWAHVRYTSPMVATGLVAGCLGYARLTNWLRPKGVRFVAGAWIVVASGLVAADWTLLAEFAKAPRPFTPIEAREIRTWIDRVGPDDGVLAHYDVCAPLSSRQTLYSYVMTNNEPPGFPDALGPEILWVFVRTREIERAQGTFGRQGFRLVYGGDSLRVYRRDRPEGPARPGRRKGKVRPVPFWGGNREELPMYLIGLGFDVLNRVLRVVLLIAPALAVGFWGGRRIEAAHGLGASRQGVSGRDAAAAVLASRGLGDVETRTADGPFADWYDRETRTLRLSPAVADGRSFVALAVAAREAARAVRHAEGDPRDRLREPIALGLRLGRATGWALMLSGLTLCLWASLDLGATAVTLATAVALPPWLYLERNLGRLSKRLLIDAGLIVDDDLPALSKALDAVAWTPFETGPLGWFSRRRRTPLP